MSESKVFLIDNPFIDGEDIAATIEYLGMKNDGYGNRVQIKVTFTMGEETMVVTPINCSPLHPWDSLESVAAAISFASAEFEAYHYFNGDIPEDEKLGIDLNESFEDVMEYLRVNSW